MMNLPALTIPDVSEHASLEQRLERCLVVMAYIITLHGEKYAPIFDRLERELAAMKQRQDPVSRANAVLRKYTVEVGQRVAG